MTSSKKQWKLGFDSTTQQPFVKVHQPFGWKVHQHIMPVGSTMRIVSTAEVAREDALNRAMYVGGRAHITNSEIGQLPDRVPGLYTGHRPAHPPGITTITPLEETEFWCFNKIINRNKLPTLQPLVLADGEPLVCDIGQRVLVCRGQVGDKFAGDWFVYDGAAMLSDGDTYGFLIGEDRV